MNFENLIAEEFKIKVILLHKSTCMKVFTECSGLVFCYSAVLYILISIASLFEIVRIKVSL